MTTSYDLSGLSPTTFQQMVQALAVREIASGVVVYGDGPDGGRDASFTGETRYRTGTAFWSGLIVIQAKFCTKRSLDNQAQRRWLETQIAKEFARYSADASRPRPSHYLLVTNLDLTATPTSGSMDRVRASLHSASSALGCTDSDIWDGHKLRALLDNNRDIAISYGGYIVTGDVLHWLAQCLKTTHPDFMATMTDYLHRELVGPDQFARLSEAGSASNRRTRLAQVLVDLQVSDTPSARDPSGQLTREGAGDLFVQTVLRLDRPARRPHRKPTDERDNRFVLVGGPGQGKSTLTQFLCQTYRAFIIVDQEKLDPEVRATAEEVTRRCLDDGIPRPCVRRFPVRIDLKAFADELARKDSSSLLEYITRLIERGTAQRISKAVLADWLAKYPWLVVLDGLDEVPAAGNRASVIHEIKTFFAQSATRNADLLVIATSRPQGYNDDFNTEVFRHYYLLPLSTRSALRYAERLVAAGDSDTNSRKDILNRLNRAAKHDATKRLMLSPLQVTILTVLAELGGELPNDRWELFDQYYQTICKREKQRNIPASRVLRDHQHAIDRIHRNLGLRLQIEAEQTGTNNATISLLDFRNLVDTQLGTSVRNNDERALTTEKVVEAALDRLVFLVSPHQTEIGFEIRSLQEFMAAEAMLGTSDEELRVWLSAVAIFPFWRNVFLFAAGHCAVRRTYFSSEIVSICHKLNDPTDPAAAIILAGSRLALDLLQDGIFRQAPQTQRMLASIALRLLELPPDAIHSRLGSVISSNMELELASEQALRIHLERRESPSFVSAWRALVSIEKPGLDWVVGLAQRHWPTSVNQEKRVLSVSERPGIEPLFAVSPERMCALMDPFRVYQRLHSNSSTRSRAGWANLPAWVKAGLSHFTPSAGALRARVHGLRLPIAIVFNPIRRSGERSRSFLDEFTNSVRDASDIARGWWVCLAAEEFSADPTKATLVRVLRWLERSGRRPAEAGWVGVGPWPLTASLREARRTSLAAVADAVENGAIGDTSEWMRLQEQWTDSGIIVAAGPGLFDEREFSLRTIWQSLPLFDDLPEGQTELCAMEAWSLLALHHSEFRGDSLHSIIDNAMWPYLPGMQTEKGLELPTVPDPRCFRQFINRTARSGLSASLVLAVPFSYPLSPDWIQILDEVGRTNSISYTSKGDEDRHRKLLRHLELAYRTNAAQVGLLAWVGASCEMGLRSSLSMEELPIRDSDNDDAFMLGLRVALYSQHIEAGETARLTSRSLAIINSGKHIALPRHHTSNESVTNYVLAIANSDCRAEHQFAACVSWLCMAIGSRRSGISLPTGEGLPREARASSGEPF